MGPDPYADWALVVVDVQQGFDDPFWGVRNNPAGDRNIAALVDDWASHGRPLVFVRHDSVEDESPLDPGKPGNQLKPYLKADPDLVVSKSVNSAFHGTPDLHAWLVERKTAGIVVCGITTNHCCETTARVGGNLGHEVLFAGQFVLRLVIPIWGFFAGFAFGAGLVAELADERFLGTVLGWVLGLVFALVFAVFAYLYFYVAVTLAMAAFGFAIGSGLVVASTMSSPRTA